MLTTGTAIDQAFLDDSPYAPDALLIDRVLEIDRPGSRVVASMPVHDDLPLTRSQRVHPQRHPRHLNGGLMVHMTGMVGFLHAYYIFDLRHADGWIGYGAKIHNARFLALALPGSPLILAARTTRVRRSEASIVARYTFEFSQNGTGVYEGDHSAMWMLVADKT